MHEKCRETGHSLSKLKELLQLSELNATPKRDAKQWEGKRRR